MQLKIVIAVTPENASFATQLATWLRGEGYTVLSESALQQGSGTATAAQPQQSDVVVALADQNTLEDVDWRQLLREAVAAHKPIYVVPLHPSDALSQPLGDDVITWLGETLASPGWLGTWLGRLFGSAREPDTTLVQLDQLSAVLHQRALSIGRTVKLGSQPPPQVPAASVQPPRPASVQEGSSVRPSPTIPELDRDDVKRDISAERLRELMDQEAGAVAAPEPVEFAAYYPKEVAQNAWQPLKAYIYRETARSKVGLDAAAELGDAISGYRRTTDTASTPLQEGVLITATPELAGFQFNPPSASIAFYEQFERFDFRLRATGEAPLNVASNGRITFTAEGVIVADVPLSIFVHPAGTTFTPPTQSTTAPSVMGTQVATAQTYPAVFCSYSHKDEAIVERVEKAYKALGLDYLRDVTTLKSGERWNAELLEMIERADIFQLFWSANSAASKYCKQEWDHALKVGGGRVAFIRPVYWARPMAQVPSELGHIHFAYQPELDD